MLCLPWAVAAQQLLLHYQSPGEGGCFSSALSCLLPQLLQPLFPCYVPASSWSPGWHGDELAVVPGGSAILA